MACIEPISPTSFPRQFPGPLNVRSSSTTDVNKFSFPLPSFGATNRMWISVANRTPNYWIDFMISREYFVIKSPKTQISNVNSRRTSLFAIDYILLGYDLIPSASLALVYRLRICRLNYWYNRVVATECRGYHQASGYSQVLLLYEIEKPKL